MPSHKDLRACYCDASMNMSWVYEALQTDFKLTWKPKSETLQWLVPAYERECDTWLNDYIRFKVFGYDPENEYKHYETVWHMFYEKTVEWCKLYSHEVDYVDGYNAEEDDEKLTKGWCRECGCYIEYIVDSKCGDICGSCEVKPE